MAASTACAPAARPQVPAPTNTAVPSPPRATRARRAARALRHASSVMAEGTVVDAFEQVGAG